MKTGLSPAARHMVLAGICLLAASCAQLPPAAAVRPRTILGGEYWWTGMDDDYLAYLAAVKPDLIHGGVLGPELAGAMPGQGAPKAITPIWPAGVGTMADYLAWWRDYGARVRVLGIPVQATFSLVNAWGDHETRTGWFSYYDRQWEESLLGPKPAARADDLMEQERPGELGRNEGSPGWYRYRGCVNNPAWRAVLKAFVRTGIEAGFDGFITQFAHARGNCVCVHCRERFRNFLDGRYPEAELATRFGITNLAAHVFDFTAPRAGLPKAIDIEARAFTEVCVADCFDEVFTRYGRSLQPDLILAKWYHFRQFLGADTSNRDFATLIDERALLPTDSWQSGEDYIWYSSPMYDSNLKQGRLGDAALCGRYLRAMCGATPFLVLKYDYFRWRASAGEALAQGGIVFGNWKGGWSGGTDRETPHLQTYFRFISEHERYLAGRQSHADAGLLFPRSAFQTGAASFLEPFRAAGRSLARSAVLFDIVIDQTMNAADLARRRVIVVPAPEHLTADHRAVLESYTQAGGRVLALGPVAGALPTGWTVPEAGWAEDGILARAVAGAAGGISRFGVPWTVQVYADRQAAPHRLLVHLVNFNRDESQRGKELPLAADPAEIDVRAPVGFRAQRVLFLTPESAKAKKLKFTQEGDRVRFTTPGWLAYGLCVVE